MNKTRFQQVMSSIDDSLLEEAAQPHNFFNQRLRILCSATACFCVLIAGFFLLHSLSEKDNEITAQHIAEAGYQLPLPEGAVSISYSLLDFGNTPETPLAQAVFSINNTEYTIRALQTAASTNISGLSSSEESSLVWSFGPLELELCSADNDYIWFGWYSSDFGVQYCLSTKENSFALLQTARAIVEALGYNMAVAPTGATEITYQVFSLQGLTVAETSFLYEGIRYSYRTASTLEVSMMFADISGTENTYPLHLSTELGWCPAELYYTEGGAGKIIWFDIVPGLLYSLTMDSQASEETLLAVATELFVPAQGDN